MSQPKTKKKQKFFNASTYEKIDAFQQQGIKNIPSRMTAPTLESLSLQLNDLNQQMKVIAQRLSSLLSSGTHAQKSKGSQISSKGNKAEALLCSQANVRAALSTHFGKTVASVEKIPSKPHPKKSDLLLTFTDGSKVTVQNKDGDGRGRGHSYDRRAVSLVAPTSAELTETLRSVCLKDAALKRCESSKPVSLDVVTRNILGVEDEFKPAFFLHTSTSNGVVTELSICPASKFMTKLTGDLYEQADPKRTCVHLSPNIYLQRKGGGKSDAHPDDIQMKVRFTDDIAAVFTPLPLLPL